MLVRWLYIHDLPVQNREGVAEGNSSIDVE